jgi:uncharacterized membrane protein
MPATASRTTRLLVVVPLVVGGALHFVIPGTYEKIIPRALGRQREIVYLSGVLEVAAGLLLAHPRTRRFGGFFAAFVLVAVFPANVQMALDSGSPAASARGAAAWLRLPLQVPLVAWAVRHGRTARSLP